MRTPPPQICSRCKELVPFDRKSCPINSIERFGRGAPAPTPAAKPMSLLMKVGIGVVFSTFFAFWMWNILVSMKAYDLQAIPREKATLVRSGMTHQQVIDVVGRDAVAIPAWQGFQTANDQSLLQLSETAKSALETHHASACSPDRDDVCGAHYTIKDGSGLRIIYRRGIVVFASVQFGSNRRPGR